jgi:hypothetical protein
MNLAIATSSRSDEESAEVKEIFAGDYYQMTEQMWDVENRIGLFFTTAPNRPQQNCET